MFRFLHKNNDFIFIIASLTLLAIDIYYIPNPLNYYLSLLILPIVWLSKKDYFWIAFFFIIEDQPGGLFSGGTFNDPHRLPIFTIISGVSFTIRELAYLLILMKVIFHRRYRKLKIKNNFNQYLSILLIYFIILVLFSIPQGMNFSDWKLIAKVLINLTLFYSLFFILRDINEIYKFLRILFPFTFIALGLQIFSLLTASQLVNYFKPVIISVQGVLSTQELETITLRPLELEYVKVICFIGSLYFIKKKGNYFNKTYLILIIIISFFSAFIGATRTWFLAFGVILILFLLMDIKNNIKIYLGAALISIILLAYIDELNLIGDQVKDAWNRISTIEYIAHGDITASGTLKRFDIRGPKVIQGFKESSQIFGAGFSEIHDKYFDYHVGYHNMLLNSGVIGLFIFLLLTISILKKTIFTPLKKIYPSLYVAGLSFLILLIINVSIQVLGFNLVFASAFFLLNFSLVLINATINDFKKIVVECLNKNF